MTFTTLRIRTFLLIMHFVSKACAKFLNIDEVAENNAHMVAPIIQSVTNIGFITCARRCEALSSCQGLNFNKNYLLCELLAAQTSKKNVREGWWYTNNLEWLKNKKMSIGMETVTCGSLERKIRLSSGAVQCIKQVCPLDCQDPLILSQTSGIFKISPQNKRKFDVYCDFDANGGPWTVIHARVDGGVDFDRVWVEFQNGFGDLTGDFWLGNDNLHSLLSAGSYKLRIDMEYFDGVKIYAEYSTVYVASDGEKYRLDVGGYSGDAGDAMVHQNGMKFSAKDQDNDNKDSQNCADHYTGGWWFNACYEVYFTGIYYHASQLTSELKLPDELMYTGIHWSVYRDDLHPLKKVTMKVRK